MSLTACRRDAKAFLSVSPEDAAVAPLAYKGYHLGVPQVLQALAHLGLYMLVVRIAHGGYGLAHRYEITQHELILGLAQYTLQHKRVPADKAGQEPGYSLWLEARRNDVLAELDRCRYLR